VTALVSTAHIYFLTRRPMQIGGEQVVRGEIIDLTEYDLPPGRVEQLVKARLGDIVQIDEDAVVRHRDSHKDRAALAAQINEDPPLVSVSDDEGFTPPPLGEWTENLLMSLSTAQQKHLCTLHDLAVRGTLSERTDRLLEHQENSHGKQSI